MPDWLTLCGPPLLCRLFGHRCPQLHNVWLIPGSRSAVRCTRRGCPARFDVDGSWTWSL
jgi:hypothetical protein